MKTFGPGMLFASTAIGVSHLIQSTRAGAEYGLLMIVVVCLANLLKYPFFEFSSRYSNVTGTSIIDGYERLGRHFLILYLVVTLASMFIITGAVGFVTAGFFENLFGVQFLGIWSLVILFGVCFAILCTRHIQPCWNLVSCCPYRMDAYASRHFQLARPLDT
jgi:Mn2+/Fe2+ NRAMP family transporter